MSTQEDNSTWNELFIIFISFCITIPTITLCSVFTNKVSYIYPSVACIYHLLLLIFNIYKCRKSEYTVINSDQSSFFGHQITMYLVLMVNLFLFISFLTNSLSILNNPAINFSGDHTLFWFVVAECILLPFMLSTGFLFTKSNDEMPNWSFWHFKCVNPSIYGIGMIIINITIEYQLECNYVSSPSFNKIYMIIPFSLYFLSILLIIISLPCRQKIFKSLLYFSILSFFFLTTIISTLQSIRINKKLVPWTPLPSSLIINN
jgi:hypothetical protein